METQSLTWIVHLQGTAARNVHIYAKRRDGACLDCGTSENLTIHHLVPQRADVTRRLDPSNVVTLCRRCHDRRELLAWRGR